MSTYTDNRSASDMLAYLEARVEALKARVEALERENGALRGELLLSRKERAVEFLANEALRKAVQG